MCYNFWILNLFILFNYNPAISWLSQFEHSSSISLPFLHLLFKILWIADTFTHLIRPFINSFTLLNLFNILANIEHLYIWMQFFSLSLSLSLFSFHHPYLPPSLLLSYYSFCSSTKSFLCIILSIRFNLILHNLNC